MQTCPSPRISLTSPSLLWETLLIQWIFRKKNEVHRIAHGAHTCFPTNQNRRPSTSMKEEIDLCFIMAASLSSRAVQYEYRQVSKDTSELQLLGKTPDSLIKSNKRNKYISNQWSKWGQKTARTLGMLWSEGEGLMKTAFWQKDVMKVSKERTEVKNWYLIRHQLVNSRGSKQRYFFFFLHYIK